MRTLYSKTRAMLKKINVTDLRPGMHLHKLCGSWLDHPFWRTSFIIKDTAEIAEITNSGVTEVMIDILSLIHI